MLSGRSQSRSRADSGGIVGQMVCNIIFISAVIQKAFVIILFLPFLLSQGGLLSELKVGEAERQPAHREAAV